MAKKISGYFAFWLKKIMAFSHMAKLKSGVFATWLKSCLAKKKNCD